MRLFNLFGLLIVSGFGFVSCQEVDVTQTPSRVKIKTVMEMPFASQKIAYSMLSIDERKQLWIAKLENHLSDPSWNPAQIALIIDIKEQIKNGLLSEEKQLVDRHRDKWLKAALTTFKPSEITNIAYAISPISPNMQGDPPPCTCNIASDITLCIVYKLQLCGQSLCTPSTWGCGWVWRYNCDGTCQGGS